MPRKKRSRRHKKYHNSRNHFSRPHEDHVMRECSEETSLQLSFEVNHATEASNLKAGYRTPSPRVLLRGGRPRVDSFTSDRRSSSRDESLNYSKLKYLFNTSNGCHSSSLLEENKKTMSNSTLAPDLIAHIELQPEKHVITETPRISHDDLLDLDYQVEPLTCSPASGYKTPLKRLRPNYITPIFDMKDSAVRIQDLNNLQNEKTEHKIQNRSRIFNSNSLKRLQNFNELILSTSQSIDYDNCEIGDVEDDVDNQHEEANCGEMSGTEMSFFTPQLYNGKSASTPIEKNNNKSPPAEKLKMPNKIEIVKSKANVSTSTQVDKTMHNIGVQTNTVATPSSSPKSKSKEKALSVTKRRTYKSLPPTIMYYKAPTKLQSKSWQIMRTSPTRRVSMERSNRMDSVTAIETCARIFSKIKKYHGRYSSKLPEKIIDICTWLGLTIRKGVSSLYKLYYQQKSLDESTNNCNNKVCKCDSYVTQITALTASLENLRTEIRHMQQENRSSYDTVSLLHSELELIRRELHQFEDIKKELHEIKERTSHRPMPACGAPPPPPLPPPPPSLPNIPLATHKTTKVQQKKKADENARPIISLDDILKVKLRKVGDRPSPARRATEPIMSSAFRLKLRPTSRPQTPSSTASPSSTSSLSNSPHSSLTRILTNIDTNEKSTGKA